MIAKASTSPPGADVRWLALVALAACGPATPPVDAVAVRLVIVCGNCPLRVFVIDEGSATAEPDELKVTERVRPSAR